MEVEVEVEVQMTWAWSVRKISSWSQLGFLRLFRKTSTVLSTKRRRREEAGER